MAASSKLVVTIISGDPAVPWKRTHRSVAMSQLRYITPHGITVTRSSSKVPYSRGLNSVLRQLDSKLGVYLSSGYEYPERYSRWDVASISPPLEIVGRDRKISFNALNERGQALLKIFSPLLESHPHQQSLHIAPQSVVVELKPLA